MSYTYAQQKKTQAAKTRSPQESAASLRLEALQSGLVKPSAAEMGRRVDLPDAMQARMEASFGADLSAVKLYESQTVADAGANAVTQGSNIAFAPGMLDFSSYGGQALLGHELSHVVSQARGEVTGGGFLNDHALEARADREGAMAAAGQSVAMPVAAVSSFSAAPAAGPMQASKAERQSARYSRKSGEAFDQMFEADRAGNHAKARKLERKSSNYAAKRDYWQDKANKERAKRRAKQQRG